MDKDFDFSEFDDLFKEIKAQTREIDGNPEIKEYVYQPKKKPTPLAVEEEPGLHRKLYNDYLDSLRLCNGGLNPAGDLESCGKLVIARNNMCQRCFSTTCPTHIVGRVCYHCADMIKTARGTRDA